MVDNIDTYTYTYPHVVGATDAAAYAVVTIRGKDWWLCITDDGTPFFMSSDGSNDEC